MFKEFKCGEKVFVPKYFTVGIYLGKDTHHLIGFDTEQRGNFNPSNFPPFDSANVLIDKLKLDHKPKYTEWLHESEFLPVVLKKKKGNKSIKINPKILDKIVLSPEKKKSILSVLIQYDKSEKLFKKWGLGEIIEYGRGMTMLFWGGPGTGKTFTAKQIAKSLGKKLEVVDNGQVQSPMPGQFERNLTQVFEKAKTENSIIFIDECDGMIQSRKGMGQIMSSENNKLLQLIEQYDGILILASNRIGRLDEALNRRISLILEFGDPIAEERKLIWEKHLPKKLPLTKKKEEMVDYLCTFALTGGEIKNAVLAAARLALVEDKNKVDTKHFDEAINNIMESKKNFAKKHEEIPTKLFTDKQLV
jgi:SpoVK/Ycf46/Vps4 family AAA+-type ATPase